MFLLDTNVISELRKGDKADPNVLNWARGIDESAMFVSVISIMELKIGILRLKRRDARQAAVLEKWMDNQVMPTFRNRTLPVDLPVAIRCAQLHVPNPGAERDALIAATALVHGLTVVTRNISDFQIRDLPIVCPWDA